MNAILSKKMKIKKEREINREVRSILKTASYTRSVEDTERGNVVLSQLLGKRSPIVGHEVPKRLYFILKSHASCMLA